MVHFDFRNMVDPSIDYAFTSIRHSSNRSYSTDVTRSQQNFELSVTYCYESVTFPELQPRIDRFAFQSQHAEYAFMHAVKRFPADETLQGFDP
jgi:hypothetical protein